MTTPTSPPADLLAQLGELINATQTVTADAENWRVLLRLLAERGYGPRISPHTVIDLVPRPTASPTSPPPARRPRHPRRPKARPANGASSPTRIVSSLSTSTMMTVSPPPKSPGSMATAKARSSASCAPTTTETPLDTLLSAVLRAGLAHPTPAGVLSALRAAHGLVSRYAPVEPDPDDADMDRHVVLRIDAGVRWCGHCGEVVMPSMGFGGFNANGSSRCCRRPHPVPVVEILQPEEFVLR